MTPRSDLYLRPENQKSLELSSVSDASLVTIDDLASPSSLASKYVLVDHNSLLPTFHRGTADAVVAIIDHHVDEGLDLAADPRTIELVGSCASLVTDHFVRIRGTTSVPRGLADLLISSILIDTKLKPVAKGGKATDKDLEAVSLLLPHSSFATSASSTPPPGEAVKGGELRDAATATESTDEIASENDAETNLRSRAKLLSELKEDVSWMNGRDLLRRDYKEYIVAEFDGRALKYGLSTVPLGLNVWLDKFAGGKGGQVPDSPPIERLVAEVREWMLERGLGLCGVLTSYTHVKKKTGELGKHRRELLVVTTDARLARVVFDGFDQDAVLQLGEWKEKDNYGGIDRGGDTTTRAGDDAVGASDETGYERWQVWQQGNTKATRKQVAPVLKELVGLAVQPRPSS